MATYPRARDARLREVPRPPRTSEPRAHSPIAPALRQCARARCCASSGNHRSARLSSAPGTSSSHSPRSSSQIYLARILPVAQRGGQRGCRNDDLQWFLVLQVHREHQRFIVYPRLDPHSSPIPPILRTADINERSPKDHQWLRLRSAAMRMSASPSMPLTGAPPSPTHAWLRAPPRPRRCGREHHDRRSQGGDPSDVRTRGWQA